MKILTNIICTERNFWFPHALAIVCLLLVGSIAIAAPNPNIPTPNFCPGGQIRLKVTSSCNTSMDSNAKPWPIREIKANGIPNHCVEPWGYYHTGIAPQSYDFKINLEPWAFPSSSTLRTKVTVCKKPDPQRFGVALNGVVFDPEDVAIWTQTPSDACCGAKTPCIDNIPVSDEEFTAGCTKVRWQVDPEETVVDLSSIMCCDKANLDMDDRVAHTQGGGQYHYHKLTATTAAAIAGVRPVSDRMTLVGWAFDGFPVYWKYGQLTQAGEAKPMKSQYSKNNGPRTCYDLEWKKKTLETKIAFIQEHMDSPGNSGRDLADAEKQLQQVEKDLDQCYKNLASMPDVKRFPLDTFVNDYVYTKGTDDYALDECNGAKCYSPDLHTTTYCYFITEEFPYIPRCLAGNMKRTVLNYNYTAK